MKFNIIPALTASLFTLFTMTSHATELDNYLIQKNLIDQTYKIKDQKNLDTILAVLSAEDSRVYPVQIDQNTVIEKMQMYHDHIDLQGLITSADFDQFAKSVGQEQTQKFLTKGMIENCNLVFENEFQRNNPYYVKMKLSSDHSNYEIKVNNEQCKFQ